MSPFAKSIEARKILRDLNPEQLRELAKHHETTATSGAARYITEARSRSAKQTYIVEDGIDVGVRQQAMSPEKATEIANAVRAHLKDRELIEIDCTLGTHPNWRLGCRLYVTSDYARLGYMWSQSLFPPAEDWACDYMSIYVPDWPERVIFAHPTEKISFILGTDYFGEAKKSFLRMAMWDAKEKGGLGLHAGSKVLRVRKPTMGIQDFGILLFGLSGTGKTTLTVHDCGLRSPEEVVIRQDDVVLLTPGAGAAGTENGFFIKTEGLDASQEVLYNAALSSSSVFENVALSENSTLDFDDTSLTTNGRGIVLRSDVVGTDDSVNLEQVNALIFITRRDDIIPACARLSRAQAAAFFMLGESIETSAGDASKAGQAKREVGTNPFIIGQEAEEGNRLLALLEQHPEIECYLLNTGRVGKNDADDGAKLTISHSTGLLREIARGTLDYERDPFWGYDVAVAGADVDLKEVNPKNFYSMDDLISRNRALRDERVAWLKQFPGLDPRILETIDKAGL